MLRIRAAQRENLKVHRNYNEGENASFEMLDSKTAGLSFFTVHG